MEKFKSIPSEIIDALAARFTAAEGVNRQFAICDRLTRQYQALEREIDRARRSRPHRLAAAVTVEAAEEIETEYTGLVRKRKLISGLIERESENLSCLREAEAAETNALRRRLNEVFNRLALKTRDEKSFGPVFWETWGGLSRARNPEEAAPALAEIEKLFSLTGGIKRGGLGIARFVAG